MKIAALTDDASEVAIPFRKGDETASLREAVNQAISELRESGINEKQNEKRRRLQMKIVILQGSPNKKGSTNILVENFSKGAEAAGHSVIRFDLDEMNIRPCTGCVTCGYEGPCILHDDNQKIREAVLDADMIVFATPLYYYGMSAQLKIVTDRFCAYNSSITRKHMKAALLAVAWNSDTWTFDALESHYRTLVRYLDLQDQGMVLGRGCGTPSMTKHSQYPEMAYKLGNRL